MKEVVLLAGVGNMGREYAKVLDGLNVPYIAVGRGEGSSALFEKHTGKKAIPGGIKEFVNKSANIPDTAIVAVNIPQLFSACKELLLAGVKHILLEKPGALYDHELNELNELVMSVNASVFIAYNRRFYESVREVGRIILSDGGVKSFQFEFTEWSHVIEPLAREPIEKERWFLCNSSHVADLAFFLGGKPEEIISFSSGSLSWHSSGSAFCGCGVSDRGALFSYTANWNAPGRWGVEILTEHNRLYLRPLEKLQVQRRAKIDLEPVCISDKLDRDYKPGLYRMVNQFLNGDYESFCTLRDQVDAFSYYMKMVRY